MHDIQYITISAVSASEKETLLELTRLATLHECRVNHCHANKHGDHSVISMLISGNWSALAKFETGLHPLHKEAGVQLALQRTLIASNATPYLPYVLYIIAQEETQVLPQLLQFLQQDDVTVQEVFAESYPARFTMTPMQSFTIRVQLDATLSIGEWRERFMLFSDDLNLDAVMEPEKW